MQARTYSTDVCLTCPCSDCEGREVRTHVAQVPESLTAPVASLRASRAPAGVRTQQPVVERPPKAPTVGKHPAVASAANDPGGLSATAMGRLDRRWKAAIDDVQMVAANWDSQELPTLAARVRRWTAQRPRRICPRHSAVRSATEPR